MRQQVPLEYSSDATQVASFVEEVAATVDAAPVDAWIKLVDGRVELRHARAGYRLDQAASERMVTAALRGGRDASVRLPLRALPPGTSDKATGSTVTVDLSTNTLRLYQGLKVVKTYPVATAKPGFATPTGTWKVMGKLVNPAWHNPAPNGWGRACRW